MKKGIFIFFICATLLGVSLGAGACGKKKDTPAATSDYAIFASADSGKVQFGVKDLQRAEFVKSGNNWEYNGMYATYSGSEKKIVDGKLLDSLLFSDPITSVEVKNVDENAYSVVATSKNYNVTFSGKKGEPFIRREFKLKFSESMQLEKDEIVEGDVKFYLSTPVRDFKGERGFVGTYSEEDTAVYLYGALPAIYSQILGSDDKTNAAFTAVMDWDATNAIFKKARRFYNHTRSVAQVGFYNNNALINYNTEYVMVDNVMVADSTVYDSYRQLSEVRKQLSKISPVDFDNMYNYDNRGVDEYDSIAKGLTQELLDERAYNKGLNGAYTPYAYSRGWGESSTNLWISRGFTKYAASTQNADLIAEVTNKVLPLTGNGWIENAYGYGDYLHYSYSGGSFTDGDNAETSGTVKASGTWKYFDRVCAMGEIGLYTDNAQIKEAFFKLLPTVRNKMVGADYFQPICYRVDNAEPLSGLEGGGSAGGAALWGYINLLAYRMTTDADPLRQTYLNDAKGSITRASNLSFNQTWSILNAPKPMTIGWIVRGNVELYELTGDKSYLDMAKKCVSGLYHFAYALQDPYSPFYSAGYSVACAKERWAALFEMGAGLWMCAPLLRYDSDPVLLELYSAGYYGGLWYFPVNGEGTGNIHGSGSKNYEWTETKYVPYEFASGGLNDPSIAGRNDQALYRETKEIYGTGEVFMLNMIFDSYGTSSNKKVNLICTTSVDPVYNTNHVFNAFNSSVGAQTSVLRFKSLVSGVYQVKVNGTVLGDYTTAQLSGGLKMDFTGKESKKIELVKIEGNGSNKVFSSAVTLNITNNYNTSIVTALASGASHYKLEICANDKFNAANTITAWSFDGKFSDRFADSATRYYRAKAYDSVGNASEYSAVSKLSANGVNVLAADDFSEASGWAQNNTVLNTTGSAGVMNILKNDTGEGESSVSKTFKVDLSGECVFEFEPYAKTHGSYITVSLKIGEKTVKAVDGISVFDRNIYTADVKQLFSGITGEQNVTVTIAVTGINRGFMIEGVRFVALLSVKGDNCINIMEQTKSGELSANYDSGVYALSSQKESGLLKSITTQKTELKGKYLTVSLGGEGLTIIKKIRVEIYDADGKTKYFESSGVEQIISAGLKLKCNLNENAVTEFPLEPQKYIVKLASVSGNEQYYNAAYIKDVETSDNSDYTGGKSIVGVSAGDNSVEFSVTTDLTKNGILAVDISNLTKSSGTAWKIMCKDVASDEIVEMRIKDEIKGYENKSDYKTKASSDYYFRSKSGVFVYDIAGIMGYSGVREYKIIIELIGSGSMDVLRLELTNINNQLTVFN